MREYINIMKDLCEEGVEYYYFMSYEFKSVVYRVKTKI